MNLTVNRALLLCFLLLFVTACAQNSSLQTTPLAISHSPYTLKTGGNRPPAQQGLELQHADLQFDFDFENHILYGKANLTLNAPSPRLSFSVDLDSTYQLDEVAVNGQTLLPNQYHNNEGELLIEGKSEFRFPLTLSIAYSGTPLVPENPPWDGGIMWEQTPDGQPWLASAVQGEGCDIFWPCIDHPDAEPLSVDLHITVPKTLVAASNGVLINTTEQKDTHTFHWQTRSAHNTYGIALNIGPYDVIEQQYLSRFGNQYPIVYYYLPGKTAQAKALVSEIVSMLDFFELFVGPYPFAQEKVGVVQTPHLGMEHQTINAYGNDYKKDEFGFDWLLQHEFAHEYFGNQLTNDNWDHMWLHEGLGTYMQPLYAQYIGGDGAYFAYMNNIRKRVLNQKPLVSNLIREGSQVYEEQTGPGIDIYMKGAWVMHTLRYLIGDEAFFNAVRETVYGTTNPRPGNFSTLYRNTKDFITIVNKHAGKNLDWFFAVYFYQASLPKLVTTRDAQSMTLQWQVDNNLPFLMPVEISVNGKIKTLPMTSTQRVAVTDDDIVIVDPNSKLFRYEARYADFKNAN